MRKYRIQTHYEVLEVSVSASTQDIDAAYARLSKLYTEDQPALYGLVEPGRMGELRAQLTAAHEVLRDDGRRDAYDVTLGLPPRDPPAAAPQVALPAEGPASPGPTPVVEVASKPAEETPTPPPPVAAPSTSAPVPQAPVVVAAAVAPALEVEKPASAEAAVPAAAGEVPAAAAVGDPIAASIAGAVAAAVPASVAEPVRPGATAEIVSVASAPSPAAVSAVEAASAATAGGPAEAAEPAPPAPLASPPLGPPDPTPRLSDDAEVSMVVAAPSPAREHRLPEPRPRPHEVPPGVEFNGGLLRQVRMAQGVSLHQLSERTRIGARHLENLEADRYDQLPASVYLRGILMNVARELGLDGLRVARSYLQFVDAARPKG